MNTHAPSPSRVPRFTLDREEIRLSSPHGGDVSATLQITNESQEQLEGSITIRIGKEWISVQPGTLAVGPGEVATISVIAHPAALPTGYSAGEISLSTNGGSVTLPVQVSVRIRSTLRPLILSTVAVLVLTAAVGTALAGVRPSKGSFPSLPTLVHHHSTPPLPTPFSAQMRAAALREIRDAITVSNTVWQESLVHPSTSTLASVKTGTDLALARDQVQQLVTQHEHWMISQYGFHISSLQVSDDGLSGGGDVQKTEQRALFGSAHRSFPYMMWRAKYHLHYTLTKLGGHWFVQSIQVQAYTPLPSSGPTLSVQDVAARVLPVVMHIRAEGSSSVAVGTGVVIRSSANSSDILTNDHVIKDANLITLQRWIGSAYVPNQPWTAIKVWEDAGNDLAIVRINAPDLPVATWGDSRHLQPGEQVVSVGYAEDLAGGPTVTSGIISSLQRTDPNDASGATFIGHSATINPGNSGGPLANMRGEIVGINRATIDNTQGLFFAIPSSRALYVASGLVDTNG